jgi:predicted transcriptional regulator
MSDDAKRKAAREAVKAAQRQFERERDDSRQRRSSAFARARKAGLSLREISEETGLHHSSIADIIAGK